MIRVKVNGEEKTIVAVFFMRTAISKVAQGAKAIWDMIASCFSSGTWISNYLWSSTETWKNN